MLPWEGLEVPLDVAGRLETGKDEGVLQAADDVLDHPGLIRVMLPAADERVENHDEVEHVLSDLALGGLAEVEEVEEFDLEANTTPADHDVFVVDVAVVFAAGVDRRDALCQCVKDVEGFERREASLGLALEKLGEFFALYEFGDDDNHFFAFDAGHLLVVVLHQDGAVSQGIELPGVGDDGFAGGVAVRVVELGSTADARVAFGDDIDLTLIAAAQEALDDVFPSHGPPRREVESDVLRRLVHHGRILG